MLFASQTVCCEIFSLCRQCDLTLHCPELTCSFLTASRLQFLQKHSFHLKFWSSQPQNTWLESTFWKLMFISFLWSSILRLQSTLHLLSPMFNLIQATRAHVQCNLAMAGRIHLPSKAGTDFNITDD